MTDPIADMLTRIRNALAVKKSEILMPFSKVKFNIAKVLEKERLIKNAEKINLFSEIDEKQKKKSETNFDQLKISLKYNKEGNSKIKKLKRISKPGCRIYTTKDKLPWVLNNLGIAIVSTSQGLMTNKEARKKGLGGEIMCEIY
ncbi:30S ribosomal protein S8 [Candidatus Kuenenbacteria bacterium HGW-Kuenenbacteria-1]|uniref:Small ribosomal subunit protein uS8 n=1 Tax=Candidatus Kuenenbacteria bacterium HGW-Kuenenbacteria-1 TaxID=2013812 RepID=A0A2N1UNF1_9BACT|nr:MAG: 30S ribosomal protein S8 [Candidatus Kuenenbacteria bacterium HGW-Kuenenbacteria-1]